MRIDKLIQNRSRGVISKSNYDRLKYRGLFPVVRCSLKDGWNTENLDELTRQQAVDMLNTHWKVTAYEQARGIGPAIRGIVVHVVDEKDDPVPEWPEELKPYYTDCFAEAYLCQKFGLEIPNTNRADFT